MKHNPPKKKAKRKYKRKPKNVTQSTINRSAKLNFAHFAVLLQTFLHKWNSTTPRTEIGILQNINIGPACDGHTATGGQADELNAVRPCPRPTPVPLLPVHSLWALALLGLIPLLCCCLAAIYIKKKKKQQQPPDEEEDTRRTQSTSKSKSKTELDEELEDLPDPDPNMNRHFPEVAIVDPGFGFMYREGGARRGVHGTPTATPRGKGDTDSDEDWGGR